MEDLEQLRAKEVEHMTRHLEESERAMQERVQRLEASRLSLEEVSMRWLGASLCPSLGHPFGGLRVSSGPNHQYPREARGT